MVRVRADSDASPLTLHGRLDSVALFHASERENVRDGEEHWPIDLSCAARPLWIYLCFQGYYWWFALACSALDGVVLFLLLLLLQVGDVQFPDAIVVVGMLLHDVINLLSAQSSDRICFLIICQCVWVSGCVLFSQTINLWHIFVDIWLSTRWIAFWFLILFYFQNR